MIRCAEKLIVIAFILILAAWAPRGSTFGLKWHSFDAGGGLSVSDTFELHGVIGQFDAGPAMTGGSFALSGGFLAATSLPCPADIAGGDGVVDVTDLLQLLADWGACPIDGSPCPSDISGDGMVDVTDLLNLLAAWGACP